MGLDGGRRRLPLVPAPAPMPGARGRGGGVRPPAAPLCYCACAHAAPPHARAAGALRRRRGAGCVARAAARSRPRRRLCGRAAARRGAPGGHAGAHGHLRRGARHRGAGVAAVCAARQCDGAGGGRGAQPLHAQRAPRTNRHAAQPGRASRPGRAVRRTAGRARSAARRRAAQRAWCWRHVPVDGRYSGLVRGAACARRVRCAGCAGRPGGARGGAAAPHSRLERIRRRQPRGVCKAARHRGAAGRGVVVGRQPGALRGGAGGHAHPGCPARQLRPRHGRVRRAAGGCSRAQPRWPVGHRPRLGQALGRRAPRVAQPGGAAAAALRRRLRQPSGCHGCHAGCRRHPRGVQPGAGQHLRRLCPGGLSRVHAAGCRHRAACGDRAAVAKQPSRAERHGHPCLGVGRAAGQQARGQTVTSACVRRPAGVGSRRDKGAFLLAAADACNC